MAYCISFNGILVLFLARVASAFQMQKGRISGSITDITHALVSTHPLLYIMHTVSLPTPAGFGEVLVRIGLTPLLSVIVRLLQVVFRGQDPTTLRTGTKNQSPAVGR